MASIEEILAQYEASKSASGNMSIADQYMALQGGGPKKEEKEGLDLLQPVRTAFSAFAAPGGMLAGLVAPESYAAAQEEQRQALGVTDESPWYEKLEAMPGAGGVVTGAMSPEFKASGVGRIAAPVTQILGDMALDPTTYIGVGAAKGAGMAARAAGAGNLLDAASLAQKVRTAERAAAAAGGAAPEALKALDTAAALERAKIQAQIAAKVLSEGTGTQKALYRAGGFLQQAEPVAFAAPAALAYGPQTVAAAWEQAKGIPESETPIADAASVALLGGLTVLMGQGLKSAGDSLTTWQKYARDKGLAADVIKAGEDKIIAAADEMAEPPVYGPQPFIGPVEPKGFEMTAVPERQGPPIPPELTTGFALQPEAPASKPQPPRGAMEIRQFPVKEPVIPEINPNAVSLEAEPLPEAPAQPEFIDPSAVRVVQKPLDNQVAKFIEKNGGANAPGMADMLRRRFKATAAQASSWVEDAKIPVAEAVPDAPAASSSVAPAPAPRSGELHGDGTQTLGPRRKPGRPAKTFAPAVEAKLQNLGYTPEDIAAMTPEQRQKIATLETQKPAAVPEEAPVPPVAERPVEPERPAEPVKVEAPVEPVKEDLTEFGAEGNEMSRLQKEESDLLAKLQRDGDLPPAEMARLEEINARISQLLDEPDAMTSPASLKAEVVDPLDSYAKENNYTPEERARAAEYLKKMKDPYSVNARVLAERKAGVGKVPAVEGQLTDRIEGGVVEPPIYTTVGDQRWQIKRTGRTRRHAQSNEVLHEVAMLPVDAAGKEQAGKTGHMDWKPESEILLRQRESGGVIDTTATTPQRAVPKAEPPAPTKPAPEPPKAETPAPPKEAPTGTSKPLTEEETKAWANYKRTLETYPIDQHFSGEEREGAEIIRTARLKEASEMTDPAEIRKILDKNPVRPKKGRSAWRQQNSNSPLGHVDKELGRVAQVPLAAEGAAEKVGGTTEDGGSRVEQAAEGRQKALTKGQQVDVAINAVKAKYGSLRAWMDSPDSGRLEWTKSGKEPVNLRDKSTQAGKVWDAYVEAVDKGMSDAAARVYAVEKTHASANIVQQIAARGRKLASESGQRTVLEGSDLDAPLPVFDKEAHTALKAGVDKKVADLTAQLDAIGTVDDTVLKSAEFRGKLQSVMDEYAAVLHNASRGKLGARDAGRNIDPLRKLAVKIGIPEKDIARKGGPEILQRMADLTGSGKDYINLLREGGPPIPKPITKPHVVTTTHPGVKTYGGRDGVDLHATEGIKDPAVLANDILKNAEVNRLFVPTPPKGINALKAELKKHGITLEAGKTFETANEQGIDLQVYDVKRPRVEEMEWRNPNFKPRTVEVEVNGRKVEIDPEVWQVGLNAGDDDAIVRMFKGDFPNELEAELKKLGIDGFDKAAFRAIKSNDGRGHYHRVYVLPGATREGESYVIRVGRNPHFDLPTPAQRALVQPVVARGILGKSHPNASPYFWTLHKTNRRQKALEQAHLTQYGRYGQDLTKAKYHYNPPRLDVDLFNGTQAVMQSTGQLPPNMSLIDNLKYMRQLQEAAEAAGLETMDWVVGPFLRGSQIGWLDVTGERIPDGSVVYRTKVNGQERAYKLVLNDFGTAFPAAHTIPQGSPWAKLDHHARLALMKATGIANAPDSRISWRDSVERLQHYAEDLENGITVGSGKLVNHDRVMSGEFLEKYAALSERPYQALKEFHDRLAQLLDGRVKVSTKFEGFTASPHLAGLYHEQNGLGRVFLNLAEAVNHAESYDQAVDDLLYAMIHEVTHGKFSGHGTPFRDMERYIKGLAHAEGLFNEGRALLKEGFTKADYDKVRTELVPEYSKARTDYGAVVNDYDRTPKTVYHGGAGAIPDTFDQTKGALWFAEDRELSNYFAEKQMDRSGSGGAVSPAYLRIKKPVDLARLGWDITRPIDEEQLGRLRKLYPWMPDPPMYRPRFGSTGLMGDALRDAREGKLYHLNGLLDSPLFRKLAQENGYDGVKALEGGGKMTWGVFDTNQVDPAMRRRNGTVEAGRSAEDLAGVSAGRAAGSTEALADRRGGDQADLQGDLDSGVRPGADVQGGRQGETGQLRGGAAAGRASAAPSAEGRATGSAAGEGGRPEEGGVRDQAEGRIEEKRAASRTKSDIQELMDDLLEAAKADLTPVRDVFRRGYEYASQYVEHMTHDEMLEAANSLPSPRHPDQKLGVLNLLHYPDMDLKMKARIAKWYEFTKGVWPRDKVEKWENIGEDVKDLLGVHTAEEWTRLYSSKGGGFTSKDIELLRQVNNELTGRVMEAENRLYDALSNNVTGESLQKLRDQLSYQERAYYHSMLNTTRALTGVARALAIARHEIRSMDPVLRMEQDLAAGLRERLRYKFKDKGVVEDKVGQLMETFHEIRKQKDGNWEEFYKAYNAMLGSRLWPDKILEFYKAGLLGWPSRVANISSNTLFRAVRYVEDAMAGAIDKAYSGVTGAARSRYIGEAAVSAMAMRRALSEGFRPWMKAQGDAFALRPEDVSHALSKGSLMEDLLQHPGAINGKMGEFIRFPFKGLSSDDALAKHMSRVDNMYRQIYRKVRSGEYKLNPGETHTAATERIYSMLNDNFQAALNGGQFEYEHLKAWQKMATVAEDAAKSDTFQADLGNFGRGANWLLRNVPALQVVFPFVRTPTNIAKETIKRTPLGLIDIARKWKGMSEGERITELSKVAVGSLVGAGLMMKALDGSVTGGGPLDPDELETLKATGWQPYSVKVGDQWVSYQRFEPIAAIMGIAADSAEGLRNGDFQKWQTGAMRVFSTTAENITNKTFLSGLDGMFSAVSHPKQYLNRFVKQMQGSVIPNSLGFVPVSGITRALDPVYRQTDPLSMNVFYAKLPYLSSTLDPQYGPTGEERMRTGTALERIISPFSRTAVKTGPQADGAEEVVRLSAAPKAPGRYWIGRGGVRVDFTAEEKASMARAYREATALIGQRLVKDPNYQKMPDDEFDPNYKYGMKTKKDIIRKIYNGYRDRVMDGIKPSLEARAARQVAAQRES